MRDCGWVFVFLVVGFCGHAHEFAGREAQRDRRAKPKATQDLAMSK